MCNFKALNDEEKKIYHQNLLYCANSFGGKNFFLQLLEAIRETKPHPLSSSSSQFKTDLGVIKWNKSIYDETLKLLIQARVNEGTQDNFLPKEKEKNYKKILNVVRTLKPISFNVKPSNIDNGDGFSFEVFQTSLDNQKTKLNPIFDAIFFCSIETVKKALNYEIRD